MGNAKHGPRVRLSASRYGVSAVVLSALLLSLGVYRGELSATIAGAALLVYFAFSLLSLGISALLRKNLLPRVSWADDGCFRVSEGTPARRGGLCGSLLPLLGRALARTHVVITYSTDPATASGKNLKVAVPFRDGGACHNPGPLPRGNYAPRSVRVRVSDFAGFLCVSWRVETLHSVERLVVPPVPAQSRMPVLPPGATGITAGKSNRNRSDELHETRQYLPGDDPRRVNWKVYAHSGELSVREGELLPPPTSEYILAFSETFPPNAGKAERRRLQDAFDTLLSRAAHLALRLLEEHHLVTVLAASDDGAVTPRSFSREDIRAESALLEALSMPRLRDAADGARDMLSSCPPRAEILLFTLPANAPSGLSGFSARLRIFVGPSGAARERLPASAYIRRALFRDEAPPLTRQTTVDGSLVERACVALFKEGLRAEAL